METYRYSSSNDFNDNLKPGLLHRAIIENESITTKLIGINTSGDKVDIIFEGVLSAPEITVLESLFNDASQDIEIHDYERVMSIDPFKSSFRNTGYVQIASFICPPSSKVCVRAIVFINTNGETYDLKLFDAYYARVIKEEVNLDNTYERIIELDHFSNEEETIVEVHGKRNGTSVNGEVFVRQILVHYD